MTMRPCDVLPLTHWETSTLNRRKELSSECSRIKMRASELKRLNRSADEEPPRLPSGPLRSGFPTLTPPSGWQHLVCARAPERFQIRHCLATMIRLYARKRPPF